METHIRDPKTKAWVRTDVYWAKIRQEQLEKDPVMANVKPAGPSKLDDAKGSVLWLYTDLQRALTSIRRAVDRLPYQETYRVMGAYDLVMDFLSDDQAQKHRALDPGMLFLMAGYNEPPNKQLGNLTVYTVTERKKRQRKTWLVTPGDGDKMSKVWGPTVSAALTELADQRIRMISHENVILETFGMG